MTVREYRSMNPMRNCRKNSSSADGPATPATVTKRSGVSVAAMRKTLSSFCGTAPDRPVTRSRKAVVARDQEPARTEEKTVCIDNHEDALRDAGRPGGALMALAEPVGTGGGGHASSVPARSHRRHRLPGGDESRAPDPGPMPDADAGLRLLPERPECSGRRYQFCNG